MTYAFVDQYNDIISIGDISDYLRDYGTDDLATIKKMVRRDTEVTGPIRRVDYKSGTEAYRLITA